MRLNFHRAHVRLWTWLSNNPQKQKSHWPEWKHNYDRIHHVTHNCFACEVAVSCCPNCPLRSERIGCKKFLGLYDCWVSSHGTNRAKFALQIANLPWKGRKMFTYKDGEWS